MDARHLSDEQLEARLRERAAAAFKAELVVDQVHSACTLALFEHNLPAEQWPTIVSQTESTPLPPDPRRLRAVDDQLAS